MIQPRARGTLPRAYLRIDPDLDSTHPEAGWYLKLLCCANRQPERGRFRDRRVIASALGKARLERFIERRDLIQTEDGKWYVVGWDEWQEGDWTVGDRMRAIRARRLGVSPEDLAPTPAAERTARWRLRTEILERDGYACRYCGSADQRQWLILEHVIPNGPSTPENLVTACRPCNKRKGGKTPEQAGMPLRPILLRDASHGLVRDASQRPS